MKVDPEILTPWNKDIYTIYKLKKIIATPGIFNQTIPFSNQLI